MINIQDKKDCCGCTACFSVCPKKCITMKSDKEGFSYPVTDKGKCVGCGLCEKVCPIIRNKHSDEKTICENMTKEVFTQKVIADAEEKPDCYIAFNSNDKIRQRSTSGGFFTAAAEFVLSEKGKVYGVEVDKNKVVRHSCADNEKALAKFRGSKYVQSEQNGIYQKIKSDLDSGIWVLYTGTPCQVEGLYNYLGKEYEKLLTVDIFCHGVGSPKYWNKYVNYMENKYNSKIRAVRFREKTYGYNSACMAVYFENGKVSRKDHDSDLYWTAFSKCYIFRPSCYDCKFKSLNHRSDFSIGDFWNTEAGGADFANSNGCSLVLVHSDKGRRVLENIKADLTIKAFDLERALIINGGHQTSMLIKSSPVPANYSSFTAEAYDKNIADTTEKYMPLSFSKKVKCYIKPVIYKLGILDKLKRI